MTTHPIKQVLISLVESMCDVQDRMISDINVIFNSQPWHLRAPSS